MDAQDFIVNRDQHMRPLEYDLSESYNALLLYMQDLGVLDNVPVGVTSEAEIVSISDAYPAPPRALDVYGKSTQDGTPTPDAPVPILSVDDLSLEVRGKNLLSLRDVAETTSNGVTYSVTDNAIRVSGTPTSDFSLSLRTRDYFYLTTGESITFSFDNAPSNVTVIPIHQGNGGMGTVPFTTTVNAAWKYVYSIRLTFTSGRAVNATFSIQLELGSTATAYEPYVGTTVPDLLPEGTSLRSLPDGTRDQLKLAYLRPSTREGWAWYARELVQRVGDDTIANVPNWEIDSNPHVLISGFVSDMATDSHSSGKLVMCSKLMAEDARGYGSVSAMADDSICKRGTLNKVFIKTSTEYGTVSNFLLALGDTVIYYPLATTVTTQLDPIEIPQLPAPTATVWCDGGNATPTFTLGYVRDINESLSEIGTAIADIISG